MIPSHFFFIFVSEFPASVTVLRRTSKMKFNPDMTGALLIAMRMEDYKLLVALDLGVQMQI